MAKTIKQGLTHEQGQWKEIEEKIIAENKSLAESDEYESAKITCLHCVHQAFKNSKDAKHGTCEFVKLKENMFVQFKLTFNNITKVYCCSECEGRTSVTKYERLQKNE